MGLSRGRVSENSEKLPILQPSDGKTMSFRVSIGPYFYFGLVLLLIALLLLSGVLTVWEIPQWGQIKLQTDLLRIVFLGWVVEFLAVSGGISVVAGLSDRNRKVILDQTRLVLDPLFWREKIVIKYEQIGQVGWYYRRKSSLRMGPVGVAVHYYPLNSQQQIDDKRLYKLHIAGVKDQAKFLEELQKRAKGPKPTGLIPLLPNFRERFILLVIVVTLLYCPIVLLFLVKLISSSY